uniref:H0801D08.13 protein n=1 Tax=Oryza sativa TaxID=4530 RepID=Q259D9_ORYSA|nr:H0801D08.13 [Oryza sativa]
MSLAGTGRFCGVLVAPSSLVPFSLLVFIAAAAAVARAELS